jgi:hypothetical protein
MAEPTKRQREFVLEGLYLTLQSCHPEEARVVREAYRAYKSSAGRESDYRAVVDVFSRVERTPGLPTEYWELVVLAKAALGGRERADEKFEHAARRLEGLI